MDHVLWFADCTPDCTGRVGGKALGLGSLLREGLQVPPGFTVTTDAYRECVTARGLGAEIARLLDCPDSPEAQQRASEGIRALFEECCLAEDVAAEIASAYEQLCEGEPAAVAVRSSATAEDTAEASFAGQQESYLWIRGAEAVARHVTRCWGSLFTPQAICYRARLGVPLEDLAMGVVVQQMVPAEAAGVMMTIDPLTGDRSQISIEASYGLGVAVVGGEVTPDRFSVDKVTLEIRSQAVAAKPVAYRFDPEAGEVRLFDVPEEAQALPCLSPEEVVAVAALGKRIERALGAPQDIEWAVAGGASSGPREVFLLQTRPETVWSRRASEPVSEPGRPVMERLIQSMRTPLRAAPKNVGT